MREGKNCSWVLESAVERHHAAPARFFIPIEAARCSLVPGSSAKLLFLIEVPEEEGLVQCERMWVRVQSLSGATYLGVLENTPVTQTSLCRGDVVKFGPDDVADIRSRPWWRLW